MMSSWSLFNIKSNLMSLLNAWIRLHINAVLWQDTWQLLFLFCHRVVWRLHQYLLLPVCTCAVSDFSVSPQIQSEQRSNQNVFFPLLLFKKRDCCLMYWAKKKTKKKLTDGIIHKLLIYWLIICLLSRCHRRDSNPSSWLFVCAVPSSPLWPCHSSSWWEESGLDSSSSSSTVSFGSVSRRVNAAAKVTLRRGLTDTISDSPMLLPRVTSVVLSIISPLSLDTTASRKSYLWEILPLSNRYLAR